MHVHASVAAEPCVGVRARRRRQQAETVSVLLVVCQLVTQEQDCLRQRLQQAGKDLRLHSWTPAEHPASCSMSGGCTQSVTTETGTETGQIEVSRSVTSV